MDLLRDEKYSQDCQERWGTEGWVLLGGLHLLWDGEGVWVREPHSGLIQAAANRDANVENLHLEPPIPGKGLCQ